MAVMQAELAGGDKVGPSVGPHPPQRLMGSWQNLYRVQVRIRMIFWDGSVLGHGSELSSFLLYAVPDLIPIGI